MGDQDDRSIEFLTGGPYAESKPYSTSVCLDSGTYTFIIYDAYGDGMCCQHGNGTYAVSVSGDRKLDGGQFFGSEKSVFEIVDTTVSPSPIPTLFPTQGKDKTTLLPTFSPTSSLTRKPIKKPKKKAKKKSNKSNNKNKKSIAKKQNRIKLTRYSKKSGKKKKNNNI